jgi:hypothetical protein
VLTTRCDVPPFDELVVVVVAVAVVVADTVDVIVWVLI